MSGANWEQVGEIFAAALEREAVDRDAIIHEAAGGDQTLEAEVRSLIAHHLHAEGFLESTGVKLPDELHIDDAPALIGTTIGPWRVMREIGRGGMGVVWLVEREADGFHQIGALKRVRHGLLTEELLRRFRRERSILATLTHGGIARLLDGGTTPDGLPYLVMEFVDGRGLYEYCAEQQVGLDQRLRLMLSIGDAVDSAHRRLVLHRDLKPSNVLVTADGATKLLDFGIAKIFEDDTPPEQRDLRTMSLPLTPGYASPEQIRGDDSGTATDVYSLGIMLYELLTGRSPYPEAGDEPTARLRAVLEHEPRRPSAAVLQPAPQGRATSHVLPPAPIAETRALSRRLNGDLDTIVLKALQQDPARRYPSVAALCDDLKRFLDGLPVSAQPDAWSYRAAKFLSRHRLPVAAAALAFVALASGFGVAVWQAAVAKRESALAEQRLRDVQSIANTLMFDVYDGIENMPGATAVRQKLIEKTAHYLEALTEQAGTDSSVRFTLSDASERLGIAQRAAWVGSASGNGAAEKSFQRCRSLRESLLKQYPDNERALAGLVQVYTRLGSLYEVVGQLPAALEMMRRALQCNQRLVALHPGNHAYLAGLPKRHNNLALALLYNQRVDEATAEIHRAVDGFAALAAADSTDWQQRRLLAMSLTVYGDCLLDRSTATDSALVAERRALALYTDLWHKRPQDLDLEVRVADGHERLAGIAAQSGGAADSAVSEVEIAQAIVEAVAAQDPADRDRAIDVANGRVSEGYIFAVAGRTDPAEHVLRSVAPELERWSRADSTDTRFLLSLPQLYVGLGLVEMQHARTRSAADPLASWREARAWFTRAEASLGHPSAQQPPRDRSSDPTASLARGLAACDSALAAGHAHV